MDDKADPLYVAAEIASEYFAGEDDLEMTWRFERDEHGTSRGKMLGVEQVEDGFWVDARVWVDNHSVNAKIDSMMATPPVNQEEPAIYIGPQQIRDHFDGQGSVLERVVNDASYDQLLEIGKAVLNHDPIWEEFHNALVDAVREDLADEIEVAEARDVIAGQMQHPDTKAVVDRAIQENASRRVPRPTLPLFDSGDPDMSAKAEAMFGSGGEFGLNDDIRTLFKLCHYRRQEIEVVAEALEDLAVIVDELVSDRKRDDIEVIRTALAALRTPKT